MRVFVGLEVPEPLVGPLVRAQGGIRGAHRMVPVEDLHLTLVFCEDASDEALELFDQDMGAQRLPGCRMQLSGVRVFGEPPRVVAADVAWGQPERDLHALVHRAALRAGITPDAKRFRPHVTLARAGRTSPVDISRLLEAPPVSAAEPVRSVCLWSSTLTPDGPIYEVLASYPLEMPREAA